MPRLITFTRQNGEVEYKEFSYSKNDNLTEEDYINEMYFDCDDLSVMEGKYKDTLSNENAYWFGEELVRVYSVEEIPEEELKILQKYRVV